MQTVNTLHRATNEGRLMPGDDRTKEAWRTTFSVLHETGDREPLRLAENSYCEVMWAKLNIGCWLEVATVASELTLGSAWVYQSLLDLGVRRAQREYVRKSFG